MTGGTISFAEARRRLDEAHAAEMKRGLELIEGIVRQVAEAQGITVEDARTLMAPKIAEQIAAMNELHRLAVIDLEVLAEEGPNPRDM
ncbi:hypothetical protein [Methylobacterium sp. 285MFTsu5.1]|uniref:hypothetical protein n=1 Tax=Methylobacterium sp. 285MFTsu5.1 TaxID=1172187 RepID=UPI00036EBEDA|nr:hypothetical protein [Methylobacterium sp. 285MFTsu5.1]